MATRCSGWRFARGLLGAWRRPAAAGLAVLVACCLLATVWYLRSNLSARTRAFDKAVAAAPATSFTIRGSGIYLEFLPSIDNDNGAEAKSAIEAMTTRLYGRLKSSYPMAPRARSWGSVTTAPDQLTNPPKSAVIGRASPEFEFSFRENLTGHATLLSGRWPDQDKALADDGVAIALTPEVMSRFSAHVGSTFDIFGPYMAEHVKVVVVGVVEPLDSADAFWQSDSFVATPEVQQGPGGSPAWIAGAFVGSQGLSQLSAAYQPSAFQLAWTLPFTTTGVTADDTSALGTRMRHLSTVAEGLPVALTSNFGVTLREFTTAQRAATLETSMPAVSIAAIAILAVVLLSGAVADRRADQFALLRARGASVASLVGISAAESVATTVPAIAATLGIATFLPGADPPAMWWRAAAVPAVALAMPIILTMLRFMRTSRPRAKRLSLRMTAKWASQIAVLALCVGALQQTHAHGVAGGGKVDAFAAAAPLLASILAALVVLDVGPYLLRGLLRLVAHGKGIVGLLGFSRLTRGATTATVISVFVLTLTVCTADLSIALHRTSSSSGTELMHTAVTSSLALSAGFSVGIGCLVIAVVALGDVLDRRVATARLAMMGLTAGQIRAVALTEMCTPVLLAAGGGTAVALPLLWIVRPAFGTALGGASARFDVGTLALPVVAAVCLALLAGFVGAAVARRGAIGSLRLGNTEEGS